MGCRRKEEKEERAEGHKVGFFLALIISFRESNWLKSRKSFTARSFYQTACHSNVSSGAYKSSSAYTGMRCKGQRLGTMRQLSRSHWQANLGKEQDEKVFSSLRLTCSATILREC